MNIFLLPFAAAGDGSTEPSFDSLGLDPAIGANPEGLFAQFIVFGLLLFLLKRFAFDPIFAVMDERRKLIADSLSNADRVKKELADAQTKRDEIILQANEQAQALVASATKAAAALREKKTQDATSEAQLIKEKAEEALVLERAKMLAELRMEVAGLVVDTTAKVTGKILTSEDQRRLSDQATVELRS